MGDNIIPITVGTCVDSEPGDEGCQQGTLSTKCSLRAAVEYCTKPQFHGSLCPIAMPPGTYQMTYGAINITRGGAADDANAPLVEIKPSVGEVTPCGDTGTPLSSSSSSSSTNGLRPGRKRRLPWLPSPFSSRSPPPPPAPPSSSPQLQNPPPSSEINVNIDGTSQPDERLFNVFPGTRLKLESMAISNFGGSGLSYGGAVHNRGTFTAKDVRFTGNHATLGAVVYNGPFVSASSSSASSSSAFSSSASSSSPPPPTSSALRSTWSGGDESAATVTISDDICANNTQHHSGVDVFNSQNGTAVIICSTCSTEGVAQRSLSCAPTLFPSAAPTYQATITAAPSFAPTAVDGGGGGGGPPAPTPAVPFQGDDFEDGEDSPSKHSSGAITVAQAAWLGGAVFMIMALLLCSVVYFRTKKKKKKTTKQDDYNAAAAAAAAGGGAMGGGVDLTSSLLPSPHQPPTGGNGGGSDGHHSRVSSSEKHLPVSMHATTHRLTGVSIDDMSVVSEPLLGALESMAGHPTDWLIDMRALQLGRMIGVGSSAHVFEATYFGQFVAAKRLPALSWDRVDVEAFIRQEAGLLAHLHHPRVIKFYGVALVDDYVYMVSELCRGSLTQLLEQANASGVLLPIDLLLSLSVGIARGVEFLHSRGVVHRDIKPDNVLLTETNEVKLCDFGISRLIAQRSGMTTAVGTPLCMAPELVRAGTAGNRDEAHANAAAIDVYSFGVLLWMLWTQRLNPYSDVDDPWRLLGMIVNGRRPALPPPPSSSAAAAAAAAAAEQVVEEKEGCGGQTKQGNGERDADGQAGAAGEGEAGSTSGQSEFGRPRFQSRGGFETETHATMVDLMERCWDSEPAKRPTMREVAEALAECEQGMRTKRAMSAVALTDDFGVEEVPAAAAATASPSGARKSF